MAIIERKRRGRRNTTAVISSGCVDVTTSETISGLWVCLGITEKLPSADQAHVLRMTSQEFLRVLDHICRSSPVGVDGLVELQNDVRKVLTGQYLIL